MINFIICEDEHVLAKEYKRQIDNFMMNYDIDYTCYLFDGYDDKWKTFASKDEGFKIYLLDIKTAKGSGLDAARVIREELDDWTSMIIMISSYTEYKYEALSKRLMLVDFINKLDNCEKFLHNALSICIKHYDKRPKILKYTYKNIIYNIDFRHILYIEKEVDSKRCLIKTIDGDFYMQGTIKHIASLLDDRFLKCSRSTIINLEQIENYNPRKNKVTFRNQEAIDTISRDKRKELLNHVRGVN